jgi:hypothetical protein
VLPNPNGRIPVTRFIGEPCGRRPVQRSEPGSSQTERGFRIAAGAASGNDWKDFFNNLLKQACSGEAAG